MITFNISEKGVAQLREAIKTSLSVSAEQLTDDIRSIAPRDPNRPPKDLSVPVTGNLKRSIAYEVNDQLEAKIGVDLNHNLTEGKTPILEYARYQEFGTPNMPARSYLRKGMEDFGEKALKVFAIMLHKLLK